MSAPGQWKMKPNFVLKPPERFYSDRKPHWRQGPTGKSADTAADAEHARNLAVKRLRSEAAATVVAAHRAAYDNMAEKIEGCAPGRRCLHDACPLRNRARQRWFVWTAPVAAEKAKKRASDSLVVLSVIPDVRLALGSSRDHIAEQITPVVGKLRGGLEKAGVTFAVGGIDISINQARRSRRSSKPADWRPEPRVQLHHWAICVERPATPMSPPRPSGNDRSSR